jgi:hypothetical protein
LPGTDFFASAENGERWLDGRREVRGYVMSLDASDRALVSWGGLKGAVPLLLAGYPALDGFDGADTVAATVLVADGGHPFRGAGEQALINDNANEDADGDTDTASTSSRNVRN